MLINGQMRKAYCTIEKNHVSEVSVVVWELQPEDEKSLDFYEGYPWFYEKEDVKVTMEDGTSIVAMVYIMTNKIQNRIHLNLPSRSYLETVKEGYRTAGFDEAFIEDALAISKKACKKYPSRFL